MGSKGWRRRRSPLETVVSECLCANVCVMMGVARLNPLQVRMTGLGSLEVRVCMCMCVCV